MKELVIAADRNNLLKVQSFIDEQLEDAGCPMLTQIAIDVAVEELFVNIASYAYDQKIGVAVVQVEMLDDPLSVEITFIDNGKQYDPLAKPDPDITLGVKERKKGGLGIYMVKNSMDDMRYEYKEGKNILTIKKNLN
ncbi:ATP-binding protein [Roseburia sp. MSJ-14]|uniref:ATP-binding protein n=1 Tax=Roseburia sp. MSJ-14 TaxID=2841514 RepID=UPI001C124DBC|nr:ATP-binding protein [Roseburia sp. MSJ-14]MBU5471911.1 ATP-binding protein [Roseburia sp. MSJ-14]